jgi:hypothetical protein
LAIADHLSNPTNYLTPIWTSLSQEPSPADIRPLPILVKTLQLIKEKWREQHNYAYALDQLKSMRQDLTVSSILQASSIYTDDSWQVQRIKNEFTVEVYEIHGRIALEAVSERAYHGMKV